MTPASGASAVAIAHPIWLALRDRPFSGRVVGRFARACTLIDAEGRLIALTHPAIGKGPFAIVLHAAPTFFARLSPRQPVHIDAPAIALGDERVPLRDARIWDATLRAAARPLGLTPALAAIVQPYTLWPQLPSTTPLYRATAVALVRAGHALIAALTRRSGVAEAARRLAGLGPGLTPSGDDFVLGVMAALWLLDDREPLAAMAAACAPCTTQLSRAFLAAAAQGQFMETWHHLAGALARQDESGCREAMLRIAACGATSGRDALAGFAMLLMSHTVHGCSILAGEAASHPGVW